MSHQASKILCKWQKCSSQVHTKANKWTVVWVFLHSKKQYGRKLRGGLSDNITGFLNLCFLAIHFRLSGLYVCWPRVTTMLYYPFPAFCLCASHPFLLCTSCAVRRHSFVNTPSFGRLQTSTCIIRLIFARVESQTKTDLRLEVATFCFLQQHRSIWCHDLL